MNPLNRLEPAVSPFAPVGFSPAVAAALQASRERLLQLQHPSGY